MPLRRLTARDRSATANWQLAALLAFTAGTVDVSGYLALRQFTSHMSGLVAAMAADIATQGFRAFTQPAVVLSCFLAGAASCAVLVNWERRRNRESLFAVPVLLEALLLASLALPLESRHVFLTLCVLGFSMGLQNAIITKISHAEIRTTHITGMVTDIGIELGKLLYWNSPRYRQTEVPVTADLAKMKLLASLLGAFFSGGVAGALGFKHLGFISTLPLAALLLVLAAVPIADDLAEWLRPN